MALAHPPVPGEPTDDRRPWRGLTAAGAVFGALVAGASIAVGAYWIVNPNGIQFATPWPVVAWVVSALACLMLGGGVARRRRGVIAVGVLVGLVALVLLVLVADVLSFSQT